MEGLNRVPLFPNGALEMEAIYEEKKIERSFKIQDRAHIHSVCEIYFNISGQVSFAVENKVYPITAGDLIITKPNEIHYCIYNADGPHVYYTLWLRAEPEYEYLLSPFFDREPGENNRICLGAEERHRMAAYLNCMIEEQNNWRSTSIECVAATMGLLELLEKNKHKTRSSIEFPKVLMEMLTYIDEHFTEACTVERLGREFFISRSTIDRMFRKHLDTTPSRYLESRRLAHAKQLLEAGNSVQEVCERCGFSDYSHFIGLFRRRFGITPARYRKQNQ